MRTKALILSAAMVAAGVATSMAQSNVYSLNVVGYVTQVFTNNNPGGSPSTLTPVANQLATGNDFLNTVFPTVPNFTTFYEWDVVSNTFDTATYVFGSWSPNLPFTQGQAGFISTSSTFTNVYLGQVQQGSLTNTLNSGLTMTSSQVPLTGTADSLGVTAELANFDNIYKWNPTNQSYDTYTYVFGGWSGPVAGSPVINVSESFFTSRSGAAATWVTNFAVQ